jgi:thiamine biosynthesis lipoprotein
MKLLQPRRFHPLKAAWVLFVLLAFMVYTTLRDRPHPVWSWTGPTMGTTYTVKVAAPRLDPGQQARVGSRIETRLEEINRVMSTYQPDTDISRFNQSTSTGSFEVSADLVEVVRAALELCRQSGGAFDPTFGPAWALWGFGEDGRPQAAPDDDTVNSVLESCGCRHLQAVSDTALRKDRPGLHLNLNAIAPGYAVDELIAILRAEGLTNALVELGGETRAMGHNAQRQPWRIGIEEPLLDAPPAAAARRVAHLRDLALATSGDYRNYFQDEAGTVISHIFDPRRARPAAGQVASVSVVASNCLWADGLSTTLFVMGPDEGIAWLTNVPGAEALFIVRQPDGSFSEAASPGFTRLTSYPPPAGRAP